MVWPRETDPLGAGVTWYELTLSWLYSVQKGIVINTGGHGPMFQPLQLEVNTPDIEFSRQVYAFERAITTLQTLIGRPLFPEKRQQARSVRFLGCGHSKTGFAHRPAFPHQEAIINSLLTHFNQLADDATQTGPPMVPSLTPIIPWLNDPRDRQDMQKGWHTRATRYNRRRRRR